MNRVFIFLLILIYSCSNNLTEKGESIQTGILQPNFTVKPNDVKEYKEFIDLGENVFGTKKIGKENFGYILNSDHSKIFAQYWQTPVDSTISEEMIKEYYSSKGGAAKFIDCSNSSAHSFIIHNLNTRLYFSGTKKKIDNYYYIITLYEYRRSENPNDW